MKKLSVIAWAVLFCMTLSGCMLFFETHSDNNPGEGSLGDARVFTGDGYTITLTDAFTEKESQVGFDGYYVSEFCGVMVQIVTPSKAEEENVKNVKDLLTQTISDNDNSSASELIEEDGLIYYHYLRDGNAGWNFAFKGAENYYLVQFVCLESSADAMKDTFITFAKSVTVE